MNLLKDFAEFANSRLEGFTGRKWLVKKVEKWLNDPRLPRFLLILGELGIGKTAIAAHLWQNMRLVDAAHFCIGGRGGTIEPLGFVRSIAEQLAQNSGGYAQALVDVQEDFTDRQVIVSSSIQTGPVDGGSVTGVSIHNLEIGALSAESALDRLIRRPLHLLEAQKDLEPISILVDALDESLTYFAQPKIIDLLRQANDLPKQVRFILTSRPSPEVRSTFADLPTTLIDAQSEENQADIAQYLLMYWEKDEKLRNVAGEWGWDKDIFAQRMGQVSEWNFLYLTLVLPEIASGQVDSVQHLPKGLDGYYLHLLYTRVGLDKWEAWGADLMEVVLALQEPASLQQIAELLGLDERPTRQRLSRVEQLLDPGEIERGFYWRYHWSVTEFLTSQNRSKDYWCDLEHGHAVISEHYLKNYSSKWSIAGLYTLEYLPIHMAKGNRIGDLQGLVEDQEWFMAKSAIDASQMSFLSDLDLAFQYSSNLGKDSWPHLVTNAFIRSTLTNIARYLPVEIYETLVRLGRETEAIQWSKSLPIEKRKYQVLRRIETALRDLEKNDLADQVRDEIASLPAQVKQDEQTHSSDDTWLIDHTGRVGAERAYRELSINAFDRTRSRDAKRCLKIAQAAHKAGKTQDSCQFLQKCLGLLTNAFEWDLRELLPQIAKLLIELNKEQDIIKVLDLALSIDLEPQRIYTLSELALVCSDANDASVRKQTLERTVYEIQNAKRTKALQFELSKIALAMAIIGDQRANEYLEKALSYARQARQPAWEWNERSNWGKVAISLSTIGLFDETLELLKDCDEMDYELGEVAVNFAVNDRWERAIDIAKSLRYIARSGALVRTAHALLDEGRLTDEQYGIICEYLENDLEEEKQTRRRLDMLIQLFGVATKKSDSENIAKYLNLFLNELKKLDAPKAKSDLIVNISNNINNLSEFDAIIQIQSVANSLDNDQHSSRPNAFYAISSAIARIGKIEEAWSLASTIPDDETRLLMHLEILEQAHNQSQLKGLEPSLRNTIEIARGLENRSGLPTHWGRLAVLAYELKLVSELEECISNAVKGSISVEPNSHISFNVYNCAFVAQNLHELGCISQARELLEIGIKYLEQPQIDIGPFRRIARVITTTKERGLLENEFKAALQIEKPDQKAEALIGITYSMTKNGEGDLATQNFSYVVEAVKAVYNNQNVVRDFCLLLIDVFGTDSDVINEYVVDVLTHVRLKDRPTVITWVAGLLPVFAEVDIELAQSILKRLRLADGMFEIL
ncbi:hypothetical protein ACFLZW_02475 [Chloroflexota bacterium]